MTGPLTVAGALRRAADAGLPRAEAQYLVQALLNCSRAWLISHDTDTLDPAQQARFEHWLAQRLDEVPLAYLVGEKEFFGMSLRVTPDTLIPRPDTELLVEWALERLPVDRPVRVVDLGTGSGAIALALKSQRPLADVHMVDKSTAALAVAVENAQRLGLSVHAHAGNWFEALAGEAPFDVVVSNPPYVAQDDTHLTSLRHEPLTALTPGGDGLRDLHHLITEAPRWLTAGGWLMLEHGYNQAPAIVTALQARGFHQVENRRDLGGQPRATAGRWPG